MTTPTAGPSRRSPVRWWPAAIIAALVAVALVWIWAASDVARDSRTVQTLVTVVTGLLALFAWVMVGARLSWRARGLVVAATAVLAAAFVSLVRVRGVSGDLVPVLEWRFQAIDDAALAALPGPAPGPAVAAPEPAVPEPVAAPPETVAAQPESASAIARDYPQFLGPDRNGTVRGVRLARDWDSRPPELVWQREVGVGWSGFAVAHGLAITQEQRGDDELVVAYDLATGEPRWAHRDPVRYGSALAGDGPRATPTIAAGRVVALGATGLLTVLDVETGRRVWQRDITADHAAGNPSWGRSGSPLVVDGLVVASAGGPAGGSLVAYRLEDGEPAWRGGDAASAYASPFLTTLAGRRQVVIFNDGSIAGHDPATGALLWEQPWPRGQPNVAQPVPIGGDRLLVSAGYGVGAKLIEITGEGAGRFSPRVVWETAGLKAKFANFVVHDGTVYGLDEGVLVALDPATGERLWKRGRYGHGQMILVEDLLLLQAEDGAVLLIEPSRDGLRELARFQALEGKTWNTPALAAPYLLVRNDVRAACYRLPLD